MVSQDGAADGDDGFLLAAAGQASVALAEGGVGAGGGDHGLAQAELERVRVLQEVPAVREAGECGERPRRDQRPAAGRPP
jgi:hypothetical protein